MNLSSYSSYLCSFIFLSLFDMFHAENTMFLRLCMCIDLYTEVLLYKHIE